MTPPRKENVDSISKLTDELNAEKHSLKAVLELKSYLKGSGSSDEASTYHNKVKEYADAAQQYMKK